MNDVALVAPTTETTVQKAARMAGLPAALEKAVIAGDLTYLTPDDRVKFYAAVCESIGLNPLTKPLFYVQLNGRLTLYASKDCTDQLRKIHGVSVTKLEKERVGELYVVTAYGCDKSGRTDAATGAVSLGRLSGEALANALMKGETKAKRRLTLSLCGLGMLDETEIASIPGAVVVNEASVVEVTTTEPSSPTTTDARQPHIDADGVMEEPPPSARQSNAAHGVVETPDVVEEPPATAAQANTNGWTLLQERMPHWTPAARAAIPPDEALYLMPEPEAEANREMYATAIRDEAARRKLTAKATADLRWLFFGSRTIKLDHVNIYALRALWLELTQDVA